MTENLKSHFPYPENPLNEGTASWENPVQSDIIDAEAQMLNNTEQPLYPADVPTSPMPVLEQPKDVYTAPSPFDETPTAEISSNAIRNELGLGRLTGKTEEERQAELDKVFQFQIPVGPATDSRFRGETPSVDAKPGIPEGAKRSAAMDHVIAMTPHNDLRQTRQPEAPAQHSSAIDKIVRLNPNQDLRNRND